MRTSAKQVLTVLLTITIITSLFGFAISATSSPAAGPASLTEPGKEAHEQSAVVFSITPTAQMASPIETASEWAREGIASALQKGFVPSDLQGDYMKNITRAEYCRMAVMWVEYDTGRTIEEVLTEKDRTRDPNAFSDTNDPYILAAYALGITCGTVAPTASSPGTFTPDGVFTREQAAAMTWNTCKSVGRGIGSVPPAGFADIGDASGWAVDGMNFCFANGIMQGTSASPLMFSPKAAFTREQSILTFDRIGEYSSRDTLYVAITPDIGSLYPLSITGGNVSVISAFYEPLFDYTPDGERIWLLATGIDYISDDHYTLHIREGVTFSNGNPMTAEDVLFTLDLYSKNLRLSQLVMPIDFEKTKVTGEHTIDLWYTGFSALQESGLSRVMIMNKESYNEASLSVNPIGTGPYILSEYIANSYISAKACNSYWGKRPAIKTLLFKFIPGDAQRVHALEIGEADVSPISSSDAENIAALGYDVANSSSGLSLTMLFNCREDGPLGLKEARWAVCHAINRAAVVNLAFDGLADVTGWPVSQHCLDYIPRYADMHETYTSGYNGNDIDRAKELVAQTELSDKYIRIMTDSISEKRMSAEIIQYFLMEIGVNAEICIYDPPSFMNALMDEDSYDIAIVSMRAPSMMAVEMLANHSILNSTGWTGPQRDLYDELIAAAIETSDKSARSSMIYSALEVFVDSCPWYGICEYVSPQAVSRDLRGYTQTLVGNVLYQYCYFDNVLVGNTAHAGMAVEPRCL